MMFLPDRERYEMVARLNQVGNGHGRAMMMDLIEEGRDGCVSGFVTGEGECVCSLCVSWDKGRACRERRDSERGVCYVPGEHCSMAPSGSVAGDVGWQVDRPSW